MASPPIIVRHDGRDLAVEVTGAPDGLAVFLLHGSPGSRSGPKPRGIVLHRMGIRLVCYDRPGYGWSDRDPGRHVRDAADDVAAIAEALGISSFAVVGRSGGGPHALACAAELKQVSAVAVLVSLAPADAAGLDWFDGMTQSNIDDFTAADAAEDSFFEAMADRANQIYEDPERLVTNLRPALNQQDLHVIDDFALRRLLTSSYSEALRHGAFGWIDDILAFRRPWKVDLDEISVPVKLWHGEKDTFSPVKHTEWLARRLPHAETEIGNGLGHFGAMEILPDILAWCTSPGRRIARAQYGCGSRIR